MRAASRSPRRRSWSTTPVTRHRRSRRTATSSGRWAWAIANIGALLMSRGLAYDSDEGRDFTAAITAVMTGEAYRQSAIIARDHGGPFDEYGKNREPFLRVMRKHRDAAYHIAVDGAPADLVESARHTWDEAVDLGERSRLPERAGDRPRAHRHHLLHARLRYHRHRAGHRAHQVQEAGRRGFIKIVNTTRAGRAQAAGVHRRTRSRPSSATWTSTRRSRGRPA